MSYWLAKTLLSPLLRFFYRVRVEGLEQVPATGGAVLASNHLSFCDSIFLPLVLHRRITFAAKSEYFDDRRTAWFFRAMGQIPMERGGGSASQRALDQAKQVLDSGGLVGIYPEGTRSPDGRLYKGHTGVARVAMACKVPVLAVGMVGTEDIQPVGGRPRPFMPVTVRISRPLVFDRFFERADDPVALRQITDEVMFELRELSGQEYVPAYAARRGVLETLAPERRLRDGTRTRTAGAPSPGPPASGSPGSESDAAPVAV